MSQLLLPLPTTGLLYTFINSTQKIIVIAGLLFSFFRFFSTACMRCFDLEGKLQWDKDQEDKKNYTENFKSVLSQFW